MNKIIFELSDYVNATSVEERIDQIYNAIELINHEITIAKEMKDNVALERTKYAINELIKEWQSLRGV